MKAAYAQDPPLSEMGKIMSQMVARDLVMRKAAPILAIYCAPNLVSLQTAYEISHYLGSVLFHFGSLLSNYSDRCGPIRVNADLSANRSGSGHWLTEHQLVDLGYNIDRNYEPLVSMVSFPFSERRRRRFRIRPSPSSRCPPSSATSSKTSPPWRAMVFHFCDPNQKELQ